ncbi:MAG: type II toxin-antitoxin system RatA family toxin [Pseudomonadota bacterium]
MTKHSETKSLPYTAQQMYDLVGDIEQYPKFIPWCSAARIRTRTQSGDHEVVDADLVISFKVFREKFGSRVRLWETDRRIETRYMDGPFKHMRSEWAFADTDAGCDVSFFVDFEFRNPLLQSVVGVVFYDAMQRIVRAFERRAAELYGASASAPASKRSAT